MRNHAKFRQTDQRRSEELQSLTQDTLRERFVELLNSDAKPHGVAGRMCGLYRSGRDASVDRWLDELAGPLEALRRFVQDAVENELGLIFCRWEDW